MTLIVQQVLVETKLVCTFFDGRLFTTETFYIFLLFPFFLFFLLSLSLFLVSALLLSVCAGAIAVAVVLIFKCVASLYYFKSLFNEWMSPCTCVCGPQCVKGEAGDTTNERTIIYNNKLEALRHVYCLRTQSTESYSVNIVYTTTYSVQCSALSIVVLCTQQRDTRYVLLWSSLGYERFIISYSCFALT